MDKKTHSPWLEKIKDWLLPSACVLCDVGTKGPLDLCGACMLDLPWLQTVCVRCAQPLSLEYSVEKICGVCLRQQPFFNKTVAMFSYQEPIKKLITGIKFQKKLVYAKLLGELFVQRLSTAYHKDRWPEIIIPVPLHRLRLQERGFNQAVELAKPISKKFKIKVDLHSCQRILATTAQMDLPATERYANVKNAFAIKARLKAKHVAILDDVMTTGNTVNELSKVLYKNGVARIDVWCCARTDLNN